MGSRNPSYLKMVGELYEILYSDEKLWNDLRKYSDE